MRRHTGNFMMRRMTRLLIQYGNIQTGMKGASRHALGTAIEALRAIHFERGMIDEIIKKYGSVKKTALI